MVEAANGRIVIMPGGGITADSIATIAEGPVTEFHSSARTSFPSPVKFRKQGMAMGEIRGHEYRRFTVREDLGEDVGPRSKRGDHQDIGREEAGADLNQREEDVPHCNRGDRLPPIALPSSSSSRRSGVVSRGSSVPCWRLTPVTGILPRL